MNVSTEYSAQLNFIIKRPPQSMFICFPEELRYVTVSGR